MNSTGEKLPPNWIRKESKSRANRFYYFNTKTNKTQWQMPTVDNNIKISPNKDKLSNVNKNVKSREQKRSEIDEKSKNVKKSKTPAQDRLNRQIAANKEMAKRVIETITNSTAKSQPKVVLGTNVNNRKRKREPSQSSYKPYLDMAPQPKQVVQSTNNVMSSTSTVTKKTVSTLPPKKSTSLAEPTDEIPSIFSLRNPAQNRLKQLQTNLKNDSSEILPLAINADTNESLDVIKNGFGISNNTLNRVDGQSSQHDGIEMEMEWEPIIGNDYEFPSLNNTAVNESNEPAYFVPDTNIFLNSLDCIRNITLKDENYCVLVPFAVLQELDSLKSKHGTDSLTTAAATAIKFIYNQLKSKSQRLQGQKATDDKHHIIDINNADDKILNCCLQLKNQTTEVILVTNDINLSNKALASGVDALKSSECTKKYKL